MGQAPPTYQTQQLRQQTLSGQPPHPRDEFPPLPPPNPSLLSDPGKREDGRLSKETSVGSAFSPEQSLFLLCFLFFDFGIWMAVAANALMG